MADLLMAIGRHGIGPAFALYVAANAAAYWWENRLDHPKRPAHPSASVLLHNPDYLGNGAAR